MSLSRPTTSYLRLAAAAAARTRTTSGRPSSLVAYLNGSRREASSIGRAGGSGLNFFQSQQLPANTIIKFVPQQQAWVVERMGKFHRILEPGLAILVPFLDQIKYVKSLKESAFEIPSQSAITADNVTLDIDGVLYIRVTDAYKASYGVEDADYAVQQLAQTTMRSEIGQMTLDHVLKERQALNSHITEAINEAATDWGVKCLRYEIRDIHPPANVLQAMHRQVSAERSKRAEILESEGQRQSAINIAEGERQSVILASEAEKTETINKAAGEAQGILIKAEATAEGIKKISAALQSSSHGQQAVSLQVAERYVDAFSNLAKESTTVVLPSQISDLGSWIAGGMSILNKVQPSSTTQPAEKLSGTAPVKSQSASPEKP
ncbi:spfh domain band 7 family protein [Lipomyces oligophaga]|uniref:spfh domain band 7 family protein n=1 Tax=Lipomyces oligophaga TaxID=45792 RepID=UPI0034CD09CE